MASGIGMDMVELSRAREKGHLNEDHRKTQGFALTTLLALIPLALTLVTALAACFFVLQRKSLAQSLCVQQAVRLQAELSETLTMLMKLNKKAEVLRRQRAAADKAVEIALKTGRPDLIATAKAAQFAVKLAQAALRAEQERLLSSANHTRSRHSRELRGRLTGLSNGRIQSQRFHSSGIAVRAEPANSPSPSYVPEEPFPQFQEHRFRFPVDLKPPFLPSQWEIPELRQSTECAATLRFEENRWKIKTPKASALLNSRS